VTWQEFAVLALAAYRLFRLLAWDTLTRPLRERWFGPDDAEVLAGYAYLVRCPWCLGAYVSVLVCVGWWIAPTATLYLAVPAAVSTLVGLLSKLDD